MFMLQEKYINFLDLNKYSYDELLEMKQLYELADFTKNTIKEYHQNKQS